MKNKTIQSMFLGVILLSETSMAADETIEIVGDNVEHILKPRFVDNYDYLPTVKVFMKINGTEMTINLEDTFPPSYAGQALGVIGNMIDLPYPYTIDYQMLRGILAVVSQYPISVFATWGPWKGEWNVLTDMLLGDLPDSVLVESFVNKYGSVKALIFQSPNYGVQYDQSKIGYTQEGENLACFNNDGSMAQSVFQETEPMYRRIVDKLVAKNVGVLLSDK